MQVLLLLQYYFGLLVLFTTFKHQFTNNQIFIFGAVNFQFVVRRFALISILFVDVPNLDAD